MAVENSLATKSDTTVDESVRETLGAGPVYASNGVRFAQHIPELAQAISNRLIAHARGVKGPSEGLDDSHIRTATKACLEIVADLAEGRDRSAPLAVIERFGARCAHLGLPLPAVTQAVHRGTQYLLDELAAPRRQDVTVEALACLFAARTAITEVMSSSYLREKAGGAADPDRLASNVAAALLAGRIPMVLARAGGINLATSYWVVATIFSRPFANREQSRMWWLRVHCELAKRHRHVLAMVGRCGLTLLVPGLPGHEDDARGIAEYLASALRQEVHSAVLYTNELSQLGHTANLAHELVQIAKQQHLPGGIYRREDLVLERMLSKPGFERDRLAALVQPLVSSTALIETVRAHLDTNLNRRQKANLLGVHVNTLDYRIDRIQTLTGLNIRRSDHLLRLRAAMIAYNSANFDHERREAPAGSR